MSARKWRLIVTSEAREDIRGILLYTQQYWGADQRRRYRLQLDKGLRSLLDFPERGRARDELYVGCRSLAIEEHVAFYRLSEDEVIVGRILHESQIPHGRVHP